MENVSQLTRDYELMAILIPDMSEEDNQAEIERVQGFVTAVQGEVTETLVDSPWGRRRLSYTIRHEGVDYRDGFYMVVHFTALPTAISDLERELKLDTNVIRYLLVMDDPKAGEKVTEQPEAEAEAATEAEAAPEAAEATTATDETPAEAAQVEDGASETAAEETPVDAPVTGSEAAVVEAADTTEPNAVEDVAEVIEGEEEPAPADGADDKEA